MLIQLCGCTVWSGRLLFACSKVGVSLYGANILMQTGSARRKIFVSYHVN